MGPHTVSIELDRWERGMLWHRPGRRFVVYLCIFSPYQETGGTSALPVVSSTAAVGPGVVTCHDGSCRSRHVWRAILQRYQTCRSFRHGQRARV